MPAATFPSRKRGAMTSRTICAAVASVNDGLETVPDLEPHLPVLEEREQDDTVIELLLSDAPLLGQADGVVLETLAPPANGKRAMTICVPVGGSRSVRVQLQRLALGRRTARARNCSDVRIGSGRENFFFFFFFFFLKKKKKKKKKN